MTLGEAEPGPLELATLASLAARIEPQLLRQLRLELAPRLPTEIEADFWFSDLVATRAPTGVVLRPDLVSDLRCRLAADRGRLADAWRITRHAHEHGSPTLLAEEELAYLCARGLDAADAAERAQNLLRRLLATLVDDSRPEMANWAGRALVRLPADLMRFEEASQLVLAASYRGAPLGAMLPSIDPNHSGARWLMPQSARPRTIGVRLVEGGVEFCAVSAPEALTLQITPGREFTVTVSDARDAPTTLVVDPRRTTFMPRAGGELEIRVHGGSLYRLRRREQSAQFIQQNRGHRLHVTYEDPYDSKRLVELPFVIGALAPLVPEGCEGRLAPWEQRKLIDLTLDRLVQVFAEIAPSLVVEKETTLTFRSFDDFRPERIARALSGCAASLSRKAALEIVAAKIEDADVEHFARDRALDLTTEASLTHWRQRMQKQGLSPEQVDDVLVVLTASGAGAKSKMRARGDLDSLIAEAVAEIDRTVAARVSAVMRDPKIPCLGERMAWPQLSRRTR